MAKKVFRVQVELNIQAITCPGVWLCNNGEISLQIYMLDNSVQISNYKPIFPIRCHENFLFSKIFYKSKTLTELQKELNTEWIYIELVQWRCDESGTVLATFQTTLDELLFPTTYASAVVAGVDVDLLTEATAAFPGTIAPKIEISTRTVVEELLCACGGDGADVAGTVVVNPKTMLSGGRGRSSAHRRVCHSACTRRRCPTKRTAIRRPPFCVRKVDERLITRQPQGLGPCKCRKSRSPTRKVEKKLGQITTRRCFTPQRICCCGADHKPTICPVCEEYKSCFNLAPTLFSAPCPTEKKNPTNRCVCDEPKRRGRSSSPPISSNSPRQPICLCCTSERMLSLAEKLHQRLTRTLCDNPAELSKKIDTDEGFCECCKCDSRKDTKNCG